MDHLYHPHPRGLVQRTVLQWLGTLLSACSGKRYGKLSWQLALVAALFLSITQAYGQAADAGNAVQICDGIWPEPAATASIGINDLTTASAKGCLVSGENGSNWYWVKVTTTGTMAFNVQGIQQSGAIADIDGAVWGPFASVAAGATAIHAGQAPLRCSYAAGTGFTLADGASLPTSDGVAGTGIIRSVVVTAGQYYLIFVDNFDVARGVGAVSISWDFTNQNTAGYACPTVPVTTGPGCATATSPFRDLGVKPNRGVQAAGTFTYTQCSTYSGTPFKAADGTFVHCYKVNSGAYGTIGLMEKVTIRGTDANHDNIPDCSQAILASRTVTLSTTACGANIPYSTANAGNSTTFNPEWDNLTPNTDYIICVSTTMPAATPGVVCNYRKNCADVYHWAPPLPTVAILSPPTGTTQPNPTSTVSGTATPGSTLVLTTSSGQSATVTLGTSNTYSVTFASPFPVGPNSVTATDSNIRGTASTVSSFTVVLVCTSPSVGGSASYGGGTLCTTSNAGTVSLAGYTGSITKWQTSINGGTTWTDIASTAGKVYYSFVNAINGQKFRALTNSGAPCADVPSSPVTITVNAAVCATTTCDSDAGTVTVNASTTATLGTNITRQVIATNAAGIIQYVSAPNAMSMSGVATAHYLVYVVTFDNTLVLLPTLTVGTVLGAVGGDCLKFSNQLPYNVCPGVTIAINSPVPNAVVSTVNTPVSGTATPNATVVLTDASNATLCTTTASVVGSYSCLVSLSPGSNTITATASNSTGAVSTSTSVSAVVPCTAPSDGGVVAYGGNSPLCTTANVGTLTLSGETGNVLRWETSTNGGTSWSAIANTTASLNFSNVVNGQQYRAVVNSGGTCVNDASTPVTLSVTAAACSAVFNCDYVAPAIQK